MPVGLDDAVFPPVSFMARGAIPRKVRLYHRLATCFPKCIAVRSCAGFAVASDRIIQYMKSVPDQTAYTYFCSKGKNMR